MKNNCDNFLPHWLSDCRSEVSVGVQCMNEMYGTGRLLLKAQVGTKRVWVRKGGWKPSAKNYSCESPGSKNRLMNLPLWHRSLMWLPVTSSKVLARLGLVLSSRKLQSNSLISRTSFHPCTREQWRPTLSVKNHACARGTGVFTQKYLSQSLYATQAYNLRGFLGDSKTKRTRETQVKRKRFIYSVQTPVSPISRLKWLQLTLEKATWQSMTAGTEEWNSLFK